mmetsp:Transcript_75675/g.211411  ORF Transcript_75675/g.211411 Transcript_75675/m.211411 type:complete len:216 (-) Transcript_75675:45-692(-)
MTAFSRPACSRLETSASGVPSTMTFGGKPLASSKGGSSASRAQPLACTISCSTKRRTSATVWDALNFDCALAPLAIFTDTVVVGFDSSIVGLCLFRVLVEKLGVSPTTLQMKRNTQHMMSYAIAAGRNRGNRRCPGVLPGPPEACATLAGAEDAAGPPPNDWPLPENAIGPPGRFARGYFAGLLSSSRMLTLHGPLNSSGTLLALTSSMNLVFLS